MAEQRIAFVVPRFGHEVLGGAETYCRSLAARLVGSGMDVSVLSTCALDHFTWQNHFAPGLSEVDGVTVHRFPVSERDQDRWWGLHSRISLGESLTYSEQLEWMGNSVWSRELLDAAADYTHLVAIPYLFGTTHSTAAEYPERTLLVTCLHDEPYAHLPVVRDMLQGARGCLVNARGEGELLESIAPRARSQLVGVGFDEPPDGLADAVARFCTERGVEPGYLLYAGRREAAKGLPQLFRDYRAFRQSRPDAPKLALMGSGEMQTPADLAPFVVDFGFVSDEERAIVYAGASVLLHPSRLESLGMVMMEAWLAGTPALVNAASPVLLDHCADSGGGLWYRNSPEFAESLGLLLDDEGLRSQLATAGADYVRNEYSWGAVTSRFRDALEMAA